MRLSGHYLAQAICAVFRVFIYVAGDLVPPGAQKAEKVRTRTFESEALSPIISLTSNEVKRVQSDPFSLSLLKLNLDINIRTIGERVEHW